MYLCESFSLQGVKGVYIAVSNVHFSMRNIYIVPDLLESINKWKIIPYPNIYIHGLEPFAQVLKNITVKSAHNRPQLENKTCIHNHHHYINSQCKITIDKHHTK